MGHRAAPRYRASQAKLARQVVAPRAKGAMVRRAGRQAKSWLKAGFAACLAVSWMLVVELEVRILLERCAFTLFHDSEAVVRPESMMRPVGP